MKKTKLMVTNLVHLQTEITQPCVPEVFSRLRRWSKGGGGMGLARAGEKNDLKYVMDGRSGCSSFLLLHFAALQLL